MVSGKWLVEDADRMEADDTCSSAEQFRLTLSGILRQPRANMPRKLTESDIIR